MQAGVKDAAVLTSMMLKISDLRYYRADVKKMSCARQGMHGCLGREWKAVHFFASASSICRNGHVDNFLSNCLSRKYIMYSNMHVLQYEPIFRETI